MDSPVSDASRAKMHEPDQSWPDEVQLKVIWMVNGSPVVRTQIITADAFFGRGSHSAPIEGSALIGMIENMRRAGPPERPAPRRYHGGAAKRKKINGGR